MTRLGVFVAAVSAVLLSLAIGAPAAHANANPAPIVTTYSGQSSCSLMSQFPVLITNASGDSAQTGSITVSGTISNEVQIFESQSAMQANGCNVPTNDSASWSQNFTVQPGQTKVLWLSVGGASYSSVFGAQNIAIGGMPSKTSGQSWFDFWANIDRSTYQFQSMQVNYNGTGGTDIATSQQNNFNVVQCNVNGTNVSPTLNILTPYSRGGATGPTYTQNQPVCLGWFPDGAFVNFTQGTSTQFSMKAVQLNAMQVDFAGTGNAEITSVVVNGLAANGTVTTSFDMTQYNTPALVPDVIVGNQYEGEFWMQDTAGAGSWVVANLNSSWLFLDNVTTYQLVLNGQVVGSWTNS